MYRISRTLGSISVSERTCKPFSNSFSSIELFPLVGSLQHQSLRQIENLGRNSSINEKRQAANMLQKIDNHTIGKAANTLISDGVNTNHARSITENYFKTQLQKVV